MTPCCWCATRSGAAARRGSEATAGLRWDASVELPVAIQIRHCRQEDVEAVAGLHRRWEVEGIRWGLLAEPADGLRAKS